MTGFECILVAILILWPCLWCWQGRRERKEAEELYDEGMEALEEAIEAERCLARAYKEITAKISAEPYEDDPR